MLYQLHWQFRNGKTEMCTQFELDDTLPDLKKRIWVQAHLGKAEKSHPLPDGVQWMLCSEKSEKFVMMAAQ